MLAAVRGIGLGGTYFSVCLSPSNMLEGGARASGGGGGGVSESCKGLGFCGAGWQGAPTASEGATEPVKEFISTEVADTPYKVCNPIP